MKNRFYIRGNKERGEEVIAELEKRGSRNVYGYSGCQDAIYIIDDNNEIFAMDEYHFAYSLIQETCEEIKLPPKEHRFEPFEKVVARLCSATDWRACMFSHYTEHINYPYMTGLGACEYCLPYNEETKKLIGTKLMNGRGKIRK